MKVPVGATVLLEGSADVLSRNLFGWETAIGISPVNPAGYGVGKPETGPHYDQPFGSAWVNYGPETEITFTVHEYYGSSVNVWFTAYVEGGSANDPSCKPLTAEETLGPNCAEPNSGGVQGSAADPVNTATGNFHQPFVDFVVPGRGPGLSLSHAYNSLRAGANGPLGYGWTHSYAMSLSVDTAGVVTIRQEGGAAIIFTPDGSGGFRAPRRVAATLVRNADGTWTLNRCGDTILRFSGGSGPVHSLLSIVDRNGYTTSLAYAGGQLSTVTDSAGRQLTFTWSGSRVSTVTDSSSPQRSVGFAYDAAGNLTDYTDVGGGTWHFTYDAGHRLETMRRPRFAGQPNPPVTTNVYDAASRVISQTDELNRTTLFDYTSTPGTTKVTDPKGNVTVETYRDLVRTSLTRGGSKWTFSTHDTLGITRVKDPLGNIVAATYDDRGNLTSLRDDLGHTSRATYNAFDQPLTVTDAAGVTTTFVYDPAGNLTSVSTPLNVPGPVQTTSYGYDPARPGDVISVTDPKLKVWTQAYDALGNQTSASDPLGNVARYGYDSRGFMTSAVSPRGSAVGVLPGCTPPAVGCTRIDRDAFGRATVVTDADGNQSARHYDANGNLDWVKDGEDKVSTVVYDVADQPVTVVRPDLSTLANTYWPDGSLRQQIDGATRATSYGYDAQGRLTTTTDPNGRVTTFGYDPAGNPVTRAEPGGTCPAWPIPSDKAALVQSPTASCTVASYRNDGKLQWLDYSDPATPDVSSVSYDAVGRRVAMVVGSDTSTWGWDSLGRPTQATQAGRQVRYEYDNLADPPSRVIYPGPGTRTVTRIFDNAGRMTSVQDWLGNITTLTPDPDSNLAKIKPPAATGLEDAYTFDNSNRLDTVTAKAGAATLSVFDYGRDNNGRVESVTSTGVADTHSYGYTGADQLGSVDGANFGYDAADNLTSLPDGTAMGYDPANQLTARTKATNVTAIAFDTRGNRTAATPAMGTGATYSYDQANRLKTVEPSSKSPSLAPGWYHSVAARSDGTVAAWGYNAYGQLGTNSVTDTLTPTNVGGLTNVVATAAGAYHSLALKADGTVWAWGWNGAGQLGTGTATDSHVPVQVLGLSSVVAVAAGPSHSLALRSDGTVWAWGYNSNGQVGNGATGDVWSPTQVQGLTGATSISAGYTHSVALKGDGTVWAWGYNGFGQLGNGTTADSYVAIAVPNLSGVGAVTSGYFHVLATKGNGTVWAWGYNGFGQLGNNTTTDRAVPAQITGLASVAEVSANGYHSMSRRSDTTVATWGWNAYGQLANATTTDAHVPQTQAALAGPTGMATGPLHALSFRPDGTARAWGSGASGALGTGGTATATTPVTVSTLNRGSIPRASYAYNGDGLRMSKTVAGATTKFTWDSSGGLPLLIDDGARAYVYGPAGLPISHVEGTTVTWYHHDQLGSSRTLTSATGAVTGRATYDSYGRLAFSTGKISPIGFAGEYTDAETGFVYLRARYYDPATGQFLTRDPLEAISRSPYGYANNDPLNAIDPTGQLAQFVVPMVIGGIGGGGFEFAVQFFTNWLSGCSFSASLSHINYTHVGFGFLLGAIGGGLGSLGKAPNTQRLLARTDRVEQHLTRLDHSPANDAMLARIRSATTEGTPLSRADRAFLRHESTEAWLMDRGVGYGTAHRVAGWTHRTFGNYDPSVIKQFPEHFGSGWKSFWGIE